MLVYFILLTAWLVYKSEFLEFLIKIQKYSRLCFHESEYMYG